MDLYRQVVFKSELRPESLNTSLQFRSDMEVAKINSYIVNYCNILSYINND